ncbi:MAG: YHYH protein [Ornithinimicrobium sp.]
MKLTNRWGHALVIPLLVVLSACGAADDDAPDSETSDSAGVSNDSSDETTTADATAAASDLPTSGDCEATAASFREVTSASADLPDPELSGTCEGDSVTVEANGIPDYPYVATSPGEPAGTDVEYSIPVNPVEASTPGEVPDLGTIAVAVNGVPLYGPTEGTGGDVLSLEGALSECGSHNGPTDFHMHLLGYAEDVDCLYTADEISTGSAPVGWSPDGYPIMSGVVCTDESCESTEQLTSSWELTDESLFATDTWSAHTYVEGSGDLDQCNGRVDADGQYRYYTTETFPYILGCYYGEVADDAISGGEETGGVQSNGGEANDADIGFCTDMAFHHEQALAMCQRVLGRPTGDEVQSLAAEILQNQSYERGLMHAWLQEWGHSTSPPETVMGWMGMQMPAEDMPGLARDAQMSEMSAASDKSL